MSSQWDNTERRRYIRIEKHFIITYYDKNDPQIKRNISQLKNISLGGICFVTAEQYQIKTEMGIELKTPYVTDAVYIEGTILESREKIPNMIYETRMSFHNISLEAQMILNKVIETFSRLSREKNK